MILHQLSHANIVVNELPDKSGLLVDLNSKNYFQLNETALIVWRGIEQGQSVNEIAAQLCKEFDVKFEHAKESVQRAIEDLRERRLVIERLSKS